MLLLLILLIVVLFRRSRWAYSPAGDIIRAAGVGLVVLIW